MNIIMELARRRSTNPDAETGADLVVGEFCAEEVGLALTLPSQTAEKRLELALSLGQRLPNVLDTLLRGRIDLLKADLIHQMTEHLDPADAARVAGEVLEKAPDLTAAEVRNLARRRAHRVKPKETEKAVRKRGEKARGVRVFEGEDGNGNLLATMAAGDVAAVWAIINSAAYQAKRASRGDGRSIGQIRVDVLIDLILGRHSRTSDTPDATNESENTENDDTPDGGIRDVDEDTSVAPQASTGIAPDGEAPHDGGAPNHQAAAGEKPCSQAPAGEKPSREAPTGKAPGSGAPAGQPAGGAPGEGAGTDPAGKAPGTGKFANPTTGQKPATNNDSRTSSGSRTSAGSHVGAGAGAGAGVDASARAEAGTRVSAEPGITVNVLIALSEYLKAFPRTTPPCKNTPGDFVIPHDLGSPEFTLHTPQSQHPPGQPPPPQKPTAPHESGVPGGPGAPSEPGAPGESGVPSRPGPGEAGTPTDAGVPGEIDGLTYPAWVIRDLVQKAAGRKGTAFRGVIYDDETGAFIAATSLTYRLPAPIAEHVRLRDRLCRMPGCRQPARRCDVDHVHAWHKGGATTECNLQCLCRRHHRLKQSPAWRIRYQDGYATWTAPNGHEYVSAPHDYGNEPYPDTGPPSDEPG